MTEEELFHKNHMLSSEFFRYVLENPEVADLIPEGARVVLLPEDDPELCQKNLEIERLAQQRDDVPDRPVVYVWIEKFIMPKPGQIVNPRLEVIKR